MEIRTKDRLRCMVGYSIRRRDVDICRYKILMETEEGVQEVLKAIYKILDADPDIVSIYYKTQNKLRQKEYLDDIEQLALEIIEKVTKSVMQKIVELARERNKK